jgi:hypothetical protein
MYYTASVFDFMLDPHEAPMNNLKDVVKSGKTITQMDFDIDLVHIQEVTKDPLVIKMREHSTLMTFWDFCTLLDKGNSLHPQDIYLVEANILYMMLEGMRRNGDFGHPLTHYLVDGTESSSLGFHNEIIYYSSEATPEMASGMEKYHRRFNQAGIMQYLRGKQFNSVQLILKEAAMDQVEVKYFPLGMDSLYGIFLILLIGIGLSSVAFLAEFIVFKLN